MRQKIISLSLDTYELASKKANFSAWVRRKLSEEARTTVIKREYECTSCSHKFFMPPNSVTGITMVEDCHECGKSSIKTGVTE